MAAWAKMQKKTFEINPKHPLIEALLERVEEADVEDSAEATSLKESAEVLWYVDQSDNYCLCGFADSAFLLSVGTLLSSNQASNFLTPTATSRKSRPSCVAHSAFLNQPKLKSKSGRLLPSRRVLSV